MNGAIEITPDEIDCEILECYRKDPTMSVKAISEEVTRSETTVRERKQKLIEAGILSFAVAIDHDRVSSFSLEAYVEVDFPGDADVHTALQELVVELARPEIREAITLVGDVDAMVRVRVQNVAELRRLVSAIRGSTRVTGTRTRIVAGRWWHGAGFERPRKRRKKRVSPAAPRPSASRGRR